MILSGPEIHRMLDTGSLVIEPFDARNLEVNSYGCHLGPTLLEYCDSQIDPHDALHVVEHTIPEAGFVLQPNRFYLGATAERIGGVDFASELYANLSTALCGMFIQTSAPLGHTGAVICWTLEIVVTQPVRVYAGTKVAKVCFWSNLGVSTPYTGRYRGSDNVVASKIIQDRT
ncbi:dCTP deaminase [Burkholderia gladioli]|uniref:dCTP deaminase n=1 Tax=Burkholderia gladioli TaxID=28095 RepID=UPI00163DF56F|nr:deoxycytidine triphosphate deaminase [Burkholderia gladioli]